VEEEGIGVRISTGKVNITADTRNKRMDKRNSRLPLFLFNRWRYS